MLLGRARIDGLPHDARQWDPPGKPPETVVKDAPPKEKGRGEAEPAVPRPLHKFQGAEIHLVVHVILAKV